MSTSVPTSSPDAGTPAGPAPSKALDRRNTWTFGPGAFGRDMVYTMVSMYLSYFLTEIVRPGDRALWWLTILLMAARLFDAVADIVMGTIVDNTRTRWGSHKPWIVGGMIASSIMSVLLFTDLHLDGMTFVAVFSVIYLLWGLTWTTNDIPFWSLLPALTVDQHARERMGSVAKLIGTVGLFVVAIGLMPVTGALGKSIGGHAAWFWVAVALVCVSIAFQLITILGVRVPAGLQASKEKTTLAGMWRVLTKNDQLAWTAVIMTLFAIGYMTTMTFGTYFFKYAYRDENMYSVFAAVMGVSQVLGFTTFPLLASRLGRKRLFSIGIVCMVIGYVMFGLAPMNITILAAAGLLMFLPEAWIVMLSLVLLTDTVEYGQWKLGNRTSSLVFAIQPFIWKAAGAVATGVVLMTAVVSGISRAQTPADVTPGGLALMKVMMLVVPVLLILAAYVLYLRKYRIDPAFYQRILGDLRERGELA